MSTQIPSQHPLMKVDDILKAAQDGQLLLHEQVAALLALLEAGQAQALREIADQLRQRQGGDTVRLLPEVPLWVTNLCEMRPSIYRYPQEGESKLAFVITIDDIEARIETALKEKARQFFIAGGLWPGLQIPGLESQNILKTYGRLIQYLHERAPDLTIHGLSPETVDFLAILSNRSYTYILEYLKDMGLSSLSGHDGDILVDSIRRKISPKKPTVKQWLGIMAEAHRLNMSGTAFITYGHFENPRHQAEHLLTLRAFAQKHPGFFSRFIPLPIPNRFQLPEAPPLGSIRRLQMIAVTRLALGEFIRQIQPHCLPDEFNETQEGLQWGASHFGTTHPMALPCFLWGIQTCANPSPGELKKLIEDTGRVATV